MLSKDGEIVTGFTGEIKAEDCGSIGSSRFSVPAMGGGQIRLFTPGSFCATAQDHAPTPLRRLRAAIGVLKNHGSPG